MKKAIFATAFTATVVLAGAQQSITPNPESTVVQIATLDKSTTDLYVEKTQQIIELTRSMENAPYNAAVQMEIQSLQAELTELKVKLLDERRASASARKGGEQVYLHPFDENKNNLKLKSFDYVMEPVTGLLNVQFEMKDPGEATVRLLTPGKVVVAHQTVDAASGTDIHFDLSKEYLRYYYLNIERDGKMCTRKISLL